jgi:hypothetical protein
MKQKKVKIISFRATNFGIFKALEFDFEKFKSGIIAIKGKSGEGKSTMQKAVKTTVQGRGSLADAEQYGDEWDSEVQLLDGDKKVFIEAKKTKGNSPTFKLFEKDLNGKKVMNPIIDGVKATPVAFMDLIANAMTFGSKDFLSENETVHRKFMFALFRDELAKLGVIFDKKHIGYEKSILGELDQLTEERDSLRNQCQHEGAYVTDFERDGYKLEQLSEMKSTDVDKLEQERNSLLVSKGQAAGDAEAEFANKKSEVIKKGAVVVEECRKISDRLMSDYNELSFANKKLSDGYNLEKIVIADIIKNLRSLSFINYDTTQGQIFGLKRDLNTFVDGLTTALSEKYPPQKEPIKPLCPHIENGRILRVEGVDYHPDFKELLQKRDTIMKEYTAVENKPVDTKESDLKIENVEKQIEIAKHNNSMINRYEINRDWVRACAEVEIKRKELAKLYSQIDTGVEGLYMKPFYSEDGKMDIKTVYTGAFDPEYFHNEGDERLLVSYSSTQKPIIGILLQVARLKLKAKALNYIFLDDVPMDKKSYAIIAKIAEENDLTILTSITGDFKRENLAENELLIEGGEVFFN